MSTVECVRWQRPVPGAAIFLWRNFLRPPAADFLLKHLLEQVPWRQDSVRVYGKRHRLPRLAGRGFSRRAASLADFDDVGFRESCGSATTAAFHETQRRLNPRCETTREKNHGLLGAAEQSRPFVNGLETEVIGCPVDEIRNRMKSAGIWLPYTGQSPEEFFLPLESFFAQALTRLCYLMKDTCELGFSIDRVDREGVLLRWRVAEQEVVVEHHYEPLPDAVPRAMAALLAPLNATFHEVAVVVVDCAESWSRSDYNVRLIVAEPHRVQALRRTGAAVWGDTPREHPEGSGLEETDFLRLPLPDELVPEAEHFPPAGSTARRSRS